MAAGSPTSSRGPTLSRERIVDAALADVARAGYESLTLRGLARALDVTAPALYDHFDSKADLLRAVAECGWRELDERFRLVEAPRAIDRCRDRSRAYVRFAEERPEIFRVMFLYRPAAVFIEADNELAAATQAFDRAAADVALAVAEGDLAEGDLAQLNLTLWAAVHGVASAALMSPPLGALVVDGVIDAMLRGLAPTRTEAP